MSTLYDAAVVGAGILGLAHAYHLARRGLKVAVFERHSRSQGASIRNFGMIWPIGQPAGDRYRLACRSRELWLEVLHASGCWHAPVGSLHLAYREDEAEVLREFLRDHGSERFCEWLPPDRIRGRFPSVNPRGLLGGMWSPAETTVDPRQVLATLPAWLGRTLGVDFHFETHALTFAAPTLTTNRGDFRTRRLLICAGADYRTLYPDAFAAEGMVACKLQMMRTRPFGPTYRLGTMLAAGLTLRHYSSFSECPSLVALQRRLDAELPDYGRFGIHVMAAQNGGGEVVIGDSHEYGDSIDPFDKPEIDRLILDYLAEFLVLPDFAIAARWHGTYVKHPERPWCAARPVADVLAVTGVGGAGMTLSFGLAEKMTDEFLEES